MLKSVRVLVALATEHDRETGLLQFACTVMRIHEKSREYVRAMPLTGSVYPSSTCDCVCSPVLVSSVHIA